MLLSRVADALYWIGRYLERAEHVSRIIDVRLDLGLDRRSTSGLWDFRRLYASVKLNEPQEIPTNPTALVEHAMFDTANRESVITCVTAARDNARQVREEISSEMWEHVNALYLDLKEAKSDRAPRPHFLSRLVIEGVHLFQGITDATMGHGEGWQFLQVGRFLERATATSALIDFHFRGDALDESGPGRAQIEWAGLLRSCSALEAYCRVYTADLRPERVAEFLLLNSEFPRSVRFAAASVEHGLRTMADRTAPVSGGRAERLAGRLHASLDYGQVDEILSDSLQAYLEGIGRQCAQIHTALHQSHIGYAIESAIPA
jgi:uncharacterized alpha-E superfamily protein